MRLERCLPQASDIAAINSISVPIQVSPLRNTAAIASFTDAPAKLSAKPLLGYMLNIITVFSPHSLSKRLLAALYTRILPRRFVSHPYLITNSDPLTTIFKDWSHAKIVTASNTGISPRISPTMTRIVRGHHVCTSQLARLTRLKIKSCWKRNNQLQNIAVLK